MPFRAVRDTVKTIIAGSRGIIDYSLVSQIIQDHPEITEIVSGLARGVDTLAKKYGEANNIPVKEFPADWDKYKKLAGIIRNEEMAAYADKLIAIWDGKSRGTEHMIITMKRLNKPTVVYTVNDYII